MNKILTRLMHNRTSFMPAYSYKCKLIFPILLVGQFHRRNISLSLSSHRYITFSKSFVWGTVCERRSMDRYMLLRAIFSVRVKQITVHLPRLGLG